MAGLIYKYRWVIVAVMVVVTWFARSQPGDALPDSWRQAEEKVMEHERAIAECMAERGWEYIPALPADVYIKREYVRAETYGRPTPDLTNMNIPPDPNDAIVSRLSEKDKEARALAYWGDIDADGDDPGCYHLTFEEVWGENLADHDATEDVVADMEVTLAADPRVIAAEAQYVACMAEHGIEVRDLDTLFDEYIKGLEELQHREKDEGESPTIEAERKALLEWWEEVNPINEACFDEFSKVREVARAEFLVEKGIWEINPYADHDH